LEEKTHPEVMKPSAKKDVELESRILQVKKSHELGDLIEKTPKPASNFF